MEQQKTILYHIRELVRFFWLYKFALGAWKWLPKKDGKEECVECRGSGWKDFDKGNLCSYCKGNGYYD